MDCRSLINSFWNAPTSSFHMLILERKLQHVKVALKEWNKNVFGNIHKLVVDNKGLLSNIQ